MKYYNLTEQEQREVEAIEAALDKDVLKSDPDLAKRRKLLQQYAKNTLDKTRNINIRLSERDLHKLKAKAAGEGIPYQTFAASILHKVAVK